MKRKPAGDDYSGLLGAAAPRRKRPVPPPEVATPLPVVPPGAEQTYGVVGELIAGWQHCPQCLDEQEAHLHGALLVFGGHIIY